MNKEKSRIQRQELQGKYSFLRAEGIQNDAMCWGFQCDDGWFPMLEELFEKIDKIAKPYKGFRINTVKEKFGGLRVYCFGSTDEIEDLIEEYAQKSYTICEVCGRKGRLRNIFHWYITLCIYHLIKRIITRRQVLSYIHWEVRSLFGKLKEWFKKEK